MFSKSVLVSSVSCTCLVALGMATLYRYFIHKEESGERRPLKRRRLSSLDEEKHPPPQSDDWAGLPTDPIVRTRPWTHAPEPGVHTVNSLLPLPVEIEDIILGTAARESPKLAEALAGIVLLSRQDTESFLANLDERNSTDDVPGFDSGSLVRRVAFSAYPKDEDIQTEVLRRCRGITEIAAPSSLFSLLFQHNERRKHWPSWDPRSRSSLAPDDAENATDLSLVMLSGAMPDAYEGFSSDEESNKLAAQRVKKLVFAQSSEQAESLFFISTSPITFFDTFKSLTHLAFRLPILGTTPPADLIANPLAFGEQLECIVFLGSKTRGLSLSPDEYTEAQYRKEVLMTHIFSDRRCLYLPDVPECLWLSEDDEYISDWADNKTDTWENAKLMTETMASNLLDTLLGHGLHISSQTDIDQLSRFLNTTIARETCRIPLQFREGVAEIAPGQILKKLTIDTSLPVTSISAVQGVKLVMDTLGSGVQDLELSYLWYEEIFDEEGCVWSALGTREPLQLTVNGSGVAMGAHPILWPSKTTKSSSRITQLVLPLGLENDKIDYEWASLPSLTHLTLPISDSTQMGQTAVDVLDVKRSAPGLHSLTLICASSVNISMLQDDIVPLLARGIAIQCVS